MTINESDSFKSWVKSNVYYTHTHDVRAMLIANNTLVSAGVDTKIVFKKIKETSQSQLRKYNSMPHVSQIILKKKKLIGNKFQTFLRQIF